jgi:hypothetical protein
VSVMADADVTVLIRLVRSFGYRNVKQLVLRVNPEVVTVGELRTVIDQSALNSSSFVINSPFVEIQTESKYLPFRKHQFGTFVALALCFLSLQRAQIQSRSTPTSMGTSPTIS